MRKFVARSLKSTKNNTRNCLLALLYCRDYKELLIASVHVNLLTTAENKQTNKNNKNKQTSFFIVRGAEHSLDLFHWQMLKMSTTTASHACLPIILFYLFILHLCIFIAVGVDSHAVSVSGLHPLTSLNNPAERDDSNITRSPLLVTNNYMLLLLFTRGNCTSVLESTH